MWEKVVGVNLNGCFYATKYVLPGMVARGWGRIINIASVHGLVASPHKAAYVAAKHGLVGLTKATALEHCRDGITCNAICPGWVMTALIQKQIDLKAERGGLSPEMAKRALIEEKQPSGECAQPEHLAALVALLCSEAGQQITGGTYTVDGGWTAQ